MLTRKRKRELDELKLKPPRLPLELWVLIGEVGGIKMWWTMVSTIPQLGRYSLSDNVQKRIKKKFTVYKKHEIIDGVNTDIHEYYKINNKYHREDGPAHIIYGDGYGKKWKEYWYKNGKKHREDGPAEIYYRIDGEVYYEEWFYEGRVHRGGNKPARIRYREDKKVAEEHWFVNGRRQKRLGKPFAIWYGEDGTKEREKYYEDENIVLQRIFRAGGTKLAEAWYKGTVIHREQGAAVTWYDAEERKFKEYWYNHGHLSDRQGPAEQWYREDGEVIKSIYLTAPKHK